MSNGSSRPKISSASSKGKRVTVSFFRDMAARTASRSSRDKTWTSFSRLHGRQLQVGAINGNCNVIYACKRSSLSRRAAKLLTTRSAIRHDHLVVLHFLL